MIYIQSNEERTRPHHFDASCAMWGAIETGQDYRLTTFEEVQSGKFNMVIPNCLFVGSVEFMREVFAKRGLTDVRLPRNSNREDEIITLGEALDRESKGEKLFIKPYEIKLFPASMLDGRMTYAYLKSLPSDTQIIANKPFEGKIKTEWRAYIHNHKSVYAGNYSGDPMYTPDSTMNLELYSALKQNQNTFPCAYTIDYGIVYDNPHVGNGVIIEYNDMWAIGNYGVPNDLYLQMLKDRYFEIIKNG